MSASVFSTICLKIIIWAPDPRVAPSKSKQNYVHPIHILIYEVYLKINSYMVHNIICSHVDLRVTSSLVLTVVHNIICSYLDLRVTSSPVPLPTFSGNHVLHAPASSLFLALGKFLSESYTASSLPPLHSFLDTFISIYLPEHHLNIFSASQHSQVLSSYNSEDLIKFFKSKY